MTDWKSGDAWEFAAAELDLALEEEEIAVQQGRPYLPIDVLISKANKIFGHGGWSFEVLDGPRKVDEGTIGTGEGTRHWQVWMAKTRLTVRGVVREDIGLNTRFGTGADGLEMSLKGCVSDGIKRGFKNLGTAFGLGLRGDQSGVAGNAGGARAVGTVWRDENGDHHIQCPTHGASYAKEWDRGETWKCGRKLGEGSYCNYGVSKDAAAAGPAAAPAQDDDPTPFKRLQVLIDGSEGRVTWNDAAVAAGLPDGKPTQAGFRTFFSSGAGTPEGLFAAASEAKTPVGDADDLPFE